MTPQFLPDDTAIQNLLASVLKAPSWAALVTSSPGAAAYWQGIVPLAHQQAASAIYRSFVQRGYTEDQPSPIALWDSGTEFETILGCGKALILGPGLATAGEGFVKQYLEYEKVLPSVLLTINGKWWPPQSTPGNVVAGRLTTAGGTHARLAPGSCDFGGGWE